MRYKRPVRKSGEKYKKDCRKVFVDSSSYIISPVNKLYALEDIREQWTSFLRKLYEELFQDSGNCPIPEITDTNVQKEYFREILLHIGYALNVKFFYGYGKTGQAERVTVKEESNYKLDDDLSSANETFRSSSTEYVSSNRTFIPSFEFLNFISPEGLLIINIVTVIIMLL